MIRLRPAIAADQPRLRAIVRQARINPLALRWQNFTLAEDEAAGLVVGTGQIRKHDDGSRELASIAVIPEYQHQGIASRIILSLLASHSGPLYLTCRHTLEPFYARFGFRTVGPEDMTPYFRRVRRIVGMFQKMAARQTEIQLLVMKREQEKTDHV